MGYRRNSLLENINILAISTTSGIVAGGTCFTMPAIYMLRLNQKLGMTDWGLFIEIFFVPFLGAVLGVLFLVPFRRYFVKQMHGKLPFPEGTATNEILATGAGGATGQAWILVYSFLIAVVYNWLSGAMKLFSMFTTAAVPALAKLTHGVKAVFALETGAEFLGLGFIIGVRYASIICAGSFLSWFVIVPLLGPLNLDQLRVLNPAATALEGVFEAQPRFALPEGLGAKLDGLDEKLALPVQEQNARRAAILEEVRPLFAAHQITLDDDAKFTVAQAGAKWKVKSKAQAFSLQLAAGGLEVHAMQPGAGDIFTAFPRNIGIGGIFAAGIISILRMGRVIVTALREALGGLFRSVGGARTADRTDDDMSYGTLLVLGILTTIAIAAYFRFSVLADMPGATRLTVIAVVLALGITFLFTTVSAWAIATISVTPISGMTVTTIIITAVILLAAGLPTQTEHERSMSMLAVLLVGGVVCTGLSMAGTLVTEFKLGYWIGASPKKIQWSAIIAAVLASAFVTATIMVCAKTPGYIAADNPEALRAPQANVMKSALESFLGGGQVPWVMYGAGAVIALLMTMLGISGLAFALGMYLPMELNTPILVGAIVAWLVQHSAKDEKLAKARSDKGILVASGLIAGGAIIGVIKNGLTAANKKFMEETINIGNWLERAGWSADSVGSLGNWLGLTLFLALCVFVYLDCRRARPEPTLGK
jgi:uncharacterized oligopeptide transporter (OPT) family protein